MTEGRSLLRLLAAAVLAFIAWPAAAEQAAFPIGYLEIAGDARYQTPRTYTGVRLKPRARPADGARLAIRESRIFARVANLAFTLERARARTAADLVAEIGRLQARSGVGFFLIDAEASVIDAVAEGTKARDLLLFNVSESSDSLRGARCRPHVMHVIPSHAMLTDALVQYLAARSWRRVLVLEGPLPADSALTRSFENSARRFGVRIVGRRDFVLGNDPRERERNNIALMTALGDYDVLFLADTDGEFGRYVPFQTSRPRPVAGTEGLIAGAWHWTWERHGAPQLNQRFDRLAGRRMGDADWAAWAAVRAIVEAAVRVKSADFRTVAAYLKSPDLVLDGYKGTRLGFRPWDNQLRQPILLHTHNAVVGRAPIAGFLHPSQNMDTLGYDRGDAKCRF